MKFKTSASEEPKTADIEIAIETVEEAPKEAKNDPKDDLLKDYKKILRDRIDLVESSLYIIKDTLRKIDELCDATND